LEFDPTKAQIILLSLSSRQTLRPTQTPIQRNQRLSVGTTEDADFNKYLLKLVAWPVFEQYIFLAGEVIMGLF
jgi:hypothetical protein